MKIQLYEYLFVYIIYHVYHAIISLFISIFIFIFVSQNDKKGKKCGFHKQNAYFAILLLIVFKQKNVNGKSSNTFLLFRRVNTSCEIQTFRFARRSGSL